MPVAIKLAAGKDFVSFLGVFVLDAIELNGCYIIGGGRKEHFLGFIELDQGCHILEERLKRISRWLNGRSEIESLALGKVTDAWYGAFHELDSIGEQI